MGKAAIQPANNTRHGIAVVEKEYNLNSSRKTLANTTLAKTDSLLDCCRRALYRMELCFDKQRTHRRSQTKMESTNLS
jgi:hypothetical protein